jgi:hypothetical protein
MGTDIHGVFQKRTAQGWEDVPSSYDERRHYQLFAVLADVRNGYGFAGVPTGEAVKPVTAPRGLPEDFAMDGDAHPVRAREVLGHRLEWHSEGEPLEVWMGDHSHSWLTGAEMLAWAEQAPSVTKVGILARDVYAKWEGQGFPDSWSGGVSGPGIKIVNDNAVEMQANPEWTHVRCHWDVSLREDLAYFFDEVARLVSEHGEVRYVFGFDS